MQRFTVPQFIDVEDKIIGPVTTRQFLVMIAAFFLVTATYAAADFSLFVFLAAIELAAAGVLAFLKVNGKPFHYFILNIMQTLKRPSVRVWKKHPEPLSMKTALGELHPPTLLALDKQASAKKFPGAQTLKELAMIMDTGGKYTGEEI